MAHFSTSYDAKQESPATLIEVNARLQSKLGVGATFANYEALKSVSAPAAKTRVKARAKNAPVEKQTKVKVWKLRKVQNEEPHMEAAKVKAAHTADSKRELGPQYVHVDKENANTYKWQHLMQEIADHAGQLSQKKIRLKDTEAIESGRKALRYKSWYIDAPKSPMERRLPIPWATIPREVTHMQGTQLLDQEIESFARFIDCSPAEKAAREAVIAEATTLISESTLDVKSEIFGSQVTGLTTPASDIDIRLSWVEGETDPGTLTWRMKKLTKALNESDEFICVVMRSSKYPIITTQHKTTGIDIQIVSAPDTKPQQEVTAQYLEELPHLRSLYAVVKTAFGIRGLVDVINGGVGSYGLFIMLIASLKRKSNLPPTTAGEQLLRFLDFYSELDMEKYGVSANPPKLFKKHDAWELPIKEQIDAARRRGDEVRAAQWAIGQRRLYQPYLFCLQDPATPLNDLGRKSNAIKHLQRTIVVLRNTLKRHVEEVSDGVARRAPRTEGSILLPLVGRCHEIYYERRKKIEEFGLQVLMKKNQTQAGISRKEVASAAG